MQHVSDILHAVIQKLLPGQFANEHDLELAHDNLGNQLLYVDSSQDITTIKASMKKALESVDVKEGSRFYWTVERQQDGSGHIIYTHTRRLVI
tara:strand:+ start:1098 stop:1376 length:279 start_codon:yes stop_codon:yes gene_type:complete